MNNFSTLVIIVFVGLIVYNITINSKCPECPIQECPIQECPIQECPIQECPIQECPIQECPIQECPIQECPIQECPIQNNTSLNENKILDDLRYRKLNDPLTAPNKIDDNSYFNYLPRFLKSISTRGSLPKYQYVGNMVNKATNKILQVLSRPTYRGSRKYESYAYDPEHNIKFNIDKVNNNDNYTKELEDNDSIKLREFANDFNFIENPNNQIIYRYDPYSI